MIPILRPDMPDFDAFAGALREIWDSAMLSNWGPYARRFEDIAASYLGVSYAKATVNADIGLTLAIAALQLPEGASVLMPSFTFNSTVNAVLWNKLRPVFCDIDPHTLCIDPADVAARMTPDVVLVSGTHVFGAPCDADALRAAADGRPILFDAAGAYGARYKGRAAGTLGDIEVFSFSATKVVMSGEGGLITTADPTIAERIDYLRGYGFFGDYESRYVGMNGKMSEIHAALGCLSLPTIEDVVARRAAILARYQCNLDGIDGLRFQHIPAGDRSVIKDMAVVFDEGRERVERALTEAGVQTKRYFRPAHTMAAYRAYANGPLPVTEQVADQVLCLPMFNALDTASIDHICDIVRATVPSGVAAVAA
jgi:dTDP-4-amino-4,6-dideoxygalactose transaminase